MDEVGLLVTATLLMQLCTWIWIAILRRRITLLMQCVDSLHQRINTLSARVDLRRL